MSKIDWLREAMSTWQASMDAFDRSEEASSERLAAAALRVRESVRLSNGDRFGVNVARNGN